MNSIVWKIIQPRIHEPLEDENAFFAGLALYVRDKEIDRMIEEVGPDLAQQAVKMFLTPVLEKDSAFIEAYFSNYDALTRLEAVSRRIADAAYAVFTGHTVAVQEDENDFIRLSAVLDTAPALRHAYEDLVSETILDLDFVRDEDKNRISRRLMQRIRI